MFLISPFLKRLKRIRNKEIPEFFSINVLLFKVSATWVPHPDIELSTRVLNYAYNNFIYITAGSVIILATASLPITWTEDKNAFVKNISLLTTQYMTLYKFAFWARNRKKLFAMLNKLDDLTHIHGEYVVDPEIGPEVHQEDFLPTEIMAKQQAKSDLASTLFWFNAAWVPLSFGVASAFTLFFDYEDNYYQIIDPEYNITIVRYDQFLPYYSVIPFDHNKGRVSFFRAIVYQVYSLSFYAWNICAFDTFFACVMSFVSGHFIVVQGAFRTIRGRCMKRLGLKDHKVILYDSPAMQDAMMKEFKKCIMHLQELFSTSESLENKFTLLTFIQIGQSLGVFCTNLYIVSMLPISPRQMSEIIYLIGVSFELMLYCYFGHRVTINADAIPDALFKADWLSANRAFKSNMLFTMTRMAKPIHFTVGKFSPLTLSTFVTISRASYSFFTVLKGTDMGGN